LRSITARRSLLMESLVPQNPTSTPLQRALMEDSTGAWIVKLWANHLLQQGRPDHIPCDQQSR
jgi:hypothetical protein